MDITQKRIFGKPVVKAYEKYIDNELVQVFVTKVKTEDYYDVYVVNEKYVTSETNSLYLQVPVGGVDNEDKYFSISFMVEMVVNYIIWSRFYEHGVACVTLGIEFEPHEQQD